MSSRICEPDDVDAVAAKLPHTLGGKLMDGAGPERVDTRMPFVGKGYPQGGRGLAIEVVTPFKPPSEGTANRATDNAKAGAHRTDGVVDVGRLIEAFAASRSLRLDIALLLLIVSLIEEGGGQMMFPTPDVIATGLDPTAAPRSRADASTRKQSRRDSYNASESGGACSEENPIDSTLALDDAPALKISVPESLAERMCPDMAAFSRPSRTTWPIYRLWRTSKRGVNIC